MRGFLIFVVVLGISVKMGWDYLNSEAFQSYGDRNKAEWTCKVDFWLGEYIGRRHFVHANSLPLRRRGRPWVN